MPPRRPPRRRDRSPSGVSILTTSAPRSLRMRVQNGPASTWLKSATRTPASGHGAELALDAFRSESEEERRIGPSRARDRCSYANSVSGPAVGCGDRAAGHGPDERIERVVELGLGHELVGRLVRVD